MIYILPQEWNSMHSEWRCPHFGRVLLHFCGWIGQGYRVYLYRFLSKEWRNQNFTIEISAFCLCCETVFFFSGVGFAFQNLWCNEGEASPCQNWDYPSFLLTLRCPFLWIKHMNNHNEPKNRKQKVVYMCICIPLSRKPLFWAFMPEHWLLVLHE